MQQMAEELQLSRRVISAVINGNPGKVRISAATEQRIRNYLAASGYVRSRSALQLKQGGNSEQVGIFYCGKFVALNYLTEALTMLTAEIRQRNGSFEITGVNPDQLYEGVSEIIAKGFRKLIWIHGNTPQEEFFHAEKLFPLFRHLDKVVIFKYDFFYSEQEKAYLDHGIELVGFDSIKSYREIARLFVSKVIPQSGSTTFFKEQIFLCPATINCWTPFRRRDSGFSDSSHRRRLRKSRFQAGLHEPFSAFIARKGFEQFSFAMIFLLQESCICCRKTDSESPMILRLRGSAPLLTPSC